MFTADGEFVIRERVLKGRKDIASLTAAFGPMKTRPKVFHVNSNVLIEPSPEGAKGSAYIKKRVYFAEPGPTAAAQTSAR